VAAGLLHHHLSLLLASAQGQHQMYDVPTPLRPGCVLLLWLQMLQLWLQQSQRQRLLLMQLQGRQLHG
jgi:hypothetical protein